MSFFLFFFLFFCLQNLQCPPLSNSSTTSRRAAGPLHPRRSPLGLAVMWPQCHRAARHSTSSQSLKPPLTATLPYKPPLTSMCPVHPTTNIPPHCPHTNTLIRIGYISFFISFATRTFNRVVAGPTVLCCTLPYMTHNPAMAAKSPPIDLTASSRHNELFLSFFQIFFFDLFSQSIGKHAGCPITARHQAAPPSQTT